MAEETRKKKKKKKSGRIGMVLTIIIIVLLVGILAALVLQRGFGNAASSEIAAVSGTSADEFKMHYVGENKVEMPQLPSEEEAAAAEAEAKAEAAKNVKKLSGKGVYSDYARMVRLSDGAVLFTKASKEKMYPASMTKIMTCILGIENVDDLDSEVTIKQEYIDAHYAEQASRAGFEAGEKVTYRDVLYGVMLPSGAEACMAVCDKVAGSESAFVDLMNKKAEELGMKNTHFTNSIGLHNEDHYTTCKDFIKLEKYALQNEIFKQIFTARSYTTSQTDVHPAGIPLTNNSYMHIDTVNLPNGAVYMGGKTGYTDEAMHTLASICRYEGEEYIMVTGHAGGVEHANIVDAVTLYSRLGEDAEEESAEE